MTSAPRAKFALRLPSPFIPFSCPPNTRDQLRGAHDLTLVPDDRADHNASTRLQPPLVSCIALFDGLTGFRIGGGTRLVPQARDERRWSVDQRS
jgi:hypothetical protein